MKLAILSSGERTVSWLSDIVHQIRPSRPSKTPSLLAIMRHVGPDTEVLSEVAQHEGWHVEIRTKHDAERRERPSLILYDRELDGVSGWRTQVENLAREYPETPVILLSGDSDDQLWQEVIELGGFDVLTRPLQRDRVVRWLQFALSTNARQC